MLDITVEDISSIKVSPFGSYNYRMAIRFTNGHVEFLVFGGKIPLIITWRMEPTNELLHSRFLQQTLDRLSNIEKFNEGIEPERFGFTKTQEPAYPF
jgi:hypothetical protein